MTAGVRARRAVRRRRSQAIDLPLPPRRHRDVPAHPRRAGTAAGARPVVLKQSFRSVPNIQRFVNAAFRDVMRRDDESLQPGYVELVQHRAGYRRPAVGDRPAGAAALRPLPRCEEKHRSSRSRMRSASSCAGWSTTAAGRSRPPAKPAAAGSRERRLPAVPALHRVSGRRDAQLRGGAGVPRRAAPARRRQDVSRARRGGCAADGARRDRMARGRAVGVCHAARSALCDRRRRAARVSRASAGAIAGTRVSSLSRPRRPAAALGADWRGAGHAARAARRPQLPPGCRHDRATDRGDACARGVHALAGRRTGAGERAAHCASSRVSTRARAACRSAALSKRCAPRRTAPRHRKRRFSRRAARASG